MGLLDFLFFATPSRKKIHFDSQKQKLSRQDVVDLVWSIDSLDSKQKTLVKNELLAKLGDGGVSKFEYEGVISHLSQKRVELGLSEIDITNLKKIMYD